MTYNYNKYSYHYKTLLSLGMPLVVGQVGTIVLGFADTLMVGHHSVTELAAASFVNTIMAIILVFALGYSYGLTPIIGRLYGQGNTEKNGAVVKHGLLAAATTSVILLAVLYLVYINIHRMGQPEELLPLMRPYMIVNMISLPFACWFNTFKQFFDGIGHTKTSMYIMIAGNILNIGGNYLLIYGPGPMPELGLLGAGISTMASRIIMFFAAAAIFLFAKKYKTYSSAMRNSRFSKELYRTIDKQSWPVALQMGMESSAFALTGVMAGWLGTTALATHQIMITISQLFFMVYYGITSAVSVRVSYYIGQNDVKQLRDVAAAGLHIVLLIGAIVVIPVLLLRNDMGYWFADSKEVAEMCAQVIILMVIYQFGDGMQMIYANALRGTGYVKPMMYIAFVSYFIISLPTSYFLGIYMNFGIVGIWTAFPICLTVAAVLYYYFFKKKVNSLTA
ncbi:MATE family efflux transporter [uncultured Prevotella sp.]|uniref:MATE family efflux transporter n=1 Tax=uncultured Prevotella sp. TaxID=159272 RepID=UPI00261701B5|nr:MATE family efflux transporter [uncultured Prevotella sp.]